MHFTKHIAGEYDDITKMQICKMCGELLVKGKWMLPSRTTTNVHAEENEVVYQSADLIAFYPPEGKHTFTTCTERKPK